MLAGVCVPAFALEHVTLRSGFSYDCTRHEMAADGRMRLYLGNDGANYIDIPADEITGVAIVPDPAKAAPAAPAAAAANEAAQDDVRAMLVEAGSRHDIDVALLASVVKAESGGRAAAVSRTGAEGLMQLMPGTARELGVNDAFAPRQNIDGGTAYLDELLTRYHNNLALALAAYNAGPAAVDRYHGIPPYAETRAYVVRVMREFKRRKQAEASMLASR